MSEGWSHRIPRLVSVLGHSVLSPRGSVLIARADYFGSGPAVLRPGGVPASMSIVKPLWFLYV